MSRVSQTQHCVNKIAPAAQAKSADPAFLVICPPCRPFVDVAARHYRVSMAGMRTPRRFSEFMVPRQVAMWLCARMRCSYASIGRYLNRDHTTVLHGCARVEARRMANAVFRYETDRLLEMAQKAAAEPRTAQFTVQAPTPRPEPRSQPRPPPREPQRPSDETTQAWEAFQEQDRRFQLAMLASGEGRS